jgi:hypothetical protein
MYKKLKKGGLTGGQKKLDKNKDGKITGEDFKMMKQGYGAARKDGMGLQDEKVKPGKVQKVFLGKMIKGAGKSIGRLFGRKKNRNRNSIRRRYGWKNRYISCRNRSNKSTDR